VINSYQLWTGLNVEDSLTDLYVDCSLKILMGRKIGCVSRGSEEGPRGRGGEIMEHNNTEHQSTYIFDNLGLNAFHLGGRGYSQLGGGVYIFIAMESQILWSDRYYGLGGDMGGGGIQVFCSLKNISQNWVFFYISFNRHLQEGLCHHFMISRNVWNGGGAVVVI